VQAVSAARALNVIENTLLFSLALAFAFQYCAGQQSSVGIYWLHQANSKLGNFPDGPWVDARLYVCLAHAIGTINTNEVTLLISEPINIGQDTLTIHQNIALQFLRGASLILQADTINILGSIEAGLWQIFEGDGRIIIGNGSVKEVYPERWGAYNDRTHARAMANAINRALQANANSTGAHKHPVKLSTGIYLIDATISFPDSQGQTLISNGWGNTIIKTDTAITMLSIPKKSLYWSLRDITFNGKSKAT
jgi:hypothetical protein